MTRRARCSPAGGEWADDRGGSAHGERARWAGGSHGGRPRRSSAGHATDSRTLAAGEPVRGAARAQLRRPRLLSPRPRPPAPRGAGGRAPERRRLAADAWSGHAPRARRSRRGLARALHRPRARGHRQQRQDHRSRRCSRPILRQRGATLATRGNLNNDIGVPLTLCELDAEHRHAVLEMGANHPGEIDYAGALARPGIGAGHQRRRRPPGGLRRHRRRGRTPRASSRGAARGRRRP
ncbi:MAG: Mur ligase family protein [Halofilum sp. (in: g-proteobacteria)]|nr:Mur ligase family protein [Halofilum sp. (in: g-proteobacteria)]